MRCGKDYELSFLQRQGGKSARSKKLDPVVKMGLGILVGGFCLITLGMFLSRPDRSIPPYSVGAQEGTLVAIHLPSWTSDPEIESLIQRFREVGRTTRDFADMKIRPTTPDDPRGRYHHLQIIVFSDPSWTEPDILHRYVEADRKDGEEENFRKEYEAAVRAGYRVNAEGQAGWIGPWNRSRSTDRTLRMQWVFQESWEEGDPQPHPASPVP